MNTATPPSSGEGTWLSAPQAVVRAPPKGPRPEPREGLARRPESPAPGSHSARTTPKFLRPPLRPLPLGSLSLLPPLLRAQEKFGPARGPRGRHSPRGERTEAPGAREKGGRRRERGAPHSGSRGAGRPPRGRGGGGCWDVTCRRPTPLRGAPPAARGRLRRPQVPAGGGWEEPPRARQGAAGSWRAGPPASAPPRRYPGRSERGRDVGLAAGRFGRSVLTGRRAPFLSEITSRLNGSSVKTVVRHDSGMTCRKG